MDFLGEIGIFLILAMGVSFLFRRPPFDYTLQEVANTEGALLEVFDAPTNYNDDDSDDDDEDDNDCHDEADENAFSSSITISVDVSDADNWLGQALLDHLTNHVKTRHIAFQRRLFLLNQTEVIELDNDIFAVQKSPLPEPSAKSGCTGGSAASQPPRSAATSFSGAGYGVGNSKTGAETQVIQVFSYHKSAIQLRDWLDRLKAHYIASFKNKLGKTRYFFQMMPSTAPLTMEGKKDLTRLPNQFSFIMKPFHTNRSFGNLFGEEIDLIRERVRFFQTRRDWYDEKGIPYTLGVLLSGPPGTGKTSTIKCLANETNRHIICVSMGSDMTRIQLENLFYNENVVVVVDGQSQTVCIPLDQRLYVLEDADAQQGSMLLRRSESPTEPLLNALQEDCMGREGKPRFRIEDAGEHLKVDLSFLLNLLDGVLENPGRLLVITSNHPEKLDAALVRPGRIDVVAQFKTCSLATLRKMVEFFYETTLDARHVQELQEVVSSGLPEAALDKRLVPEAATKVGLPEAATSGGLTPAQVYRLLFQHFGDIDAAIAAMRVEVGLPAVDETPALYSPVEPCIAEEVLQKEPYSTYSWESNYTQMCGHEVISSSWEDEYTYP
jgi:hypothetical protein